MDHFHLREGNVHCEDVPLAAIAAAVARRRLPLEALIERDTVPEWLS